MRFVYRLTSAPIETIEYNKRKIDESTMGSRSRLEPPSSSKAAIAEEEDGPTVTHSEDSPNRAGGSWRKMPERTDKGAERDTALDLFNDPNELYEPVDPAEARRLLWKIDFMILPYLAVCYAFFYIDKVGEIFPFGAWLGLTGYSAQTTLSYAAIFGIVEDLDLHGTQYSWLSSIFYFGFLAWAFPTNFMLQRFPIGRLR